jgi:3-deoxy-D-manno-octulosonic-acid transferase
MSSGASNHWLLSLYRAATMVLRPVVPMILALRQRRSKEDPDRISERRGHPGLSRPNGRLVWLHGASVGETISILPIVERLTQRGLSVLVTSGTRTSAQILAQRLPPGAMHQYIPLDVPAHLKRFLKHWRPDLAMIAESELWPNLIVETHKANVPIVLVNARLSERSYQRWRKLPGAILALLSRIDLVLAQSRDDAQRIVRLGAPRVGVAGNLKFDVAAPPADPLALAALTGLVGNRPIWIAASTHAGEEDMAITAHLALAESRPDLLTIIAPRHPHRGEAVTELAHQAGLRVARRSQGSVPDRATQVYIVDTIGELGLFYRLAPIVFVGGSLVPHGGQNPIEPAKLGVAILHGHYVHNFTDVYGALDAAGGAWMLTEESQLVHALELLLSDPSQARALAREAATAVARLGGAVDRTIQAVEPYLMSLSLVERQ